MKKIIRSTPPVSLRNFFSIKKNICDQQFQDVTLTQRGRQAISIALCHFRLSKQDTILVPGFSCRVIVEPFTEKFTPEYYDIERDLSINTEVIESMLCRGKVTVLYVIHYFGFLHGNLDQLSKLCKKYGVLLWEDHAHSALSHFSYDYADAMIFSFRKVLPIPDGGGIWLPNSSSVKFTVAGTLSSNFISMLMLANRFRMHMSRRLRGNAKPVVSSIAALIRKSSKLNHESSGDIQKSTKQITPKPISYMSQHIMQCVDFKSIFASRREIFLKWQQLFSNSRFTPVFSSLPGDVCPYSFPIWIQNVKELLSKLWENDVRIRIRWPLEPQMKEKCPTAFDISESIFPLPIYPGLLESDMERIMTLVERYGEPLTAKGN